MGRIAAQPPVSGWRLQPGAGRMQTALLSQHPKNYGNGSQLEKDTAQASATAAAGRVRVVIC